MRYVKFGLIGPYPGDEITAVRGWSQETEDRFEISQEDGKWTCLIVVPNISDDGWGFRRIPAPDDLFACMVAAENEAKRIFEAIEEQAWAESDGER